MSSAWTSFGVVILIQVVFFAITAVQQKRMGDVPKTLLQGVIIGTFVGWLYDNLLGRQLDLFSYALGFGNVFLMINASLSYGLFVASVLLLRRVSTLHFLIWISGLTAVYEITNYLSPVWIYNFSLPILPFSILCLIGYSSGALLASLIAKLIFKQPFILEIEDNKS